MTAVLPDPDTDPAGYVLAVADLREKRIDGLPHDPWTVCDANEGSNPYGPLWMVTNDAFHNPPADDDELWLAVELHTGTKDYAVHFAAEANPAHARAEVALWRGIAERSWHDEESGECDRCRMHWPCSDLLAVVAAARAYQEGTGT